MKRTTAMCFAALALLAVSAAGCTTSDADSGGLLTTANARKDIAASTLVPAPSGPATQFPHCTTSASSCP